MDPQNATKNALNEKFFKMLSELENIKNTLHSGMKVDFLYSSKSHFECFEKDISTNISELEQIIKKEIIK